LLAAGRLATWQPSAESVHRAPRLSLPSRASLSSAGIASVHGSPNSYDEQLFRFAALTLIVSGGPVDLSTSTRLSRFGITSVVVERHASTVRHPYARGFNMRAVEIFRPCAVEDAARATGLPRGCPGFLNGAESLPGREIERHGTRAFPGDPIGLGQDDRRQAARSSS